MAKKLAKNRNINFQKWFPKYNFKLSKYIKNIEVQSLRTPALEGNDRKTEIRIMLHTWLDAILLASVLVSSSGSSVGRCPLAHDPVLTLIWYELSRGVDFRGLKNRQNTRVCKESTTILAVYCVGGDGDSGNMCSITPLCTLKHYKMVKENSAKIQT